ncbi:hypothetical protein, partial [Bosea sp. TAB14]|uniref:hypothetical protein n=1 Tax=Bosea sp. TAB14 TaxID=3237481 RepID=UPI003F9032D2
LDDKTITSGPDDMIIVTDGADFLRFVPRSEDNQHYRDIVAAGLLPAIESQSSILSPTLGVDAGRRSSAASSPRAFQSRPMTAPS